MVAKKLANYIRENGSRIPEAKKRALVDTDLPNCCQKALREIIFEFVWMRRICMTAKKPELDEATLQIAERMLRSPSKPHEEMKQRREESTLKRLLSTPPQPKPKKEPSASGKKRGRPATAK